MVDVTEDPRDGRTSGGVAIAMGSDDMAEPTQAPTTQDSPETAPAAPERYGYCHWHSGHAHGIRLIEAIEQGSGPGISYHACPDCIKLHRLVPLVDR